jgi:hypothetical protein
MTGPGTSDLKTLGLAGQAAAVCQLRSLLCLVVLPVWKKVLCTGSSPFFLNLNLFAGLVRGYKVPALERLVY